MIVENLFGSMVFNDEVMIKRLPKDTYIQLKRCREEYKPLTLDVANTIANEMKDWAIEHGATHFTHWFQPMTGITAEKHNSFITPTPTGGIIMEFSGTELIQGESDASSFPSGGIRSTFEARGYTAWDPTSYAFIKDGILCIPTAFCSYNGEALDKKTPLLRSMEKIHHSSVRLLNLLGKKVSKVDVNVGAEQEYFLIDEKLFNARKDLIYTGRTLFGEMPPKGQELNDHYFGAIKPTVAKFMKELDEELWKVGIFAKTKHNESAPAQHEFAPIYTTANVATDQNQITMEIMKNVAARHGIACILHEKPFKGINGSGKHNNWSLSTDNKENLFDPGKNPDDNAHFLLFLSCMISAIDKYQDLLRISTASAGNDCRLGQMEAPPGVISLYLGDELTGILEAIRDGRTYSKRAGCNVEIGVHALPEFAMDSCDRNRTAPIAFTGNKFEFRMLGSSASIADLNTVINTMLADEFDIVSARLENVTDINKEITAIIRDIMNKHSRIIFNGNSYSAEWISEAKKRKLLNLPTTLDALSHLMDEKNIALFERTAVLNRTELTGRLQVLISNYVNKINIEAATMTYMASKHIIPAVSRYIVELNSTKHALDENFLDCRYITDTITCLQKLSVKGTAIIKKLRKSLEKGIDLNLNDGLIKFYKNDILKEMTNLREICDDMEHITAKSYWPFPTYGDLLFSIKN